MSMFAEVAVTALEQAREGHLQDAGGGGMEHEEDEYGEGGAGGGENGDEEGLAVDVQSQIEQLSDIAFGQVIVQPRYGAITCLKVTPRLIVFGTVVGWIVGISTRTFRELFRHRVMLREYALPVTCIDSVGNTLVAGHQDGELSFFDLATSQCKLTITSHALKVTNVSILDRQVYSTGLDGALHVRSLDKGALLHSFQACTCPLTALAVDNSDLVYVGGTDGVVRRISLTNRQCTMELRPKAHTNSHVRHLSLTVSPAPVVVGKAKKKKAADADEAAAAAAAAGADISNEPKIVVCVHGYGEITAWDMRQNGAVCVNYIQSAAANGGAAAFAGAANDGSVSTKHAVPGGVGAASVSVGAGAGAGSLAIAGALSVVATVPITCLPISCTSDIFRVAHVYERNDAGAGAGAGAAGGASGGAAAGGPTKWIFAGQEEHRLSIIDTANGGTHLLTLAGFHSDAITAIGCIVPDPSAAAAALAANSPLSPVAKDVPTLATPTLVTACVDGCLRGFPISGFDERVRAHAAAEALALEQVAEAWNEERVRLTNATKEGKKGGKKGKAAA